MKEKINICSDKDMQIGLFKCSECGSEFDFVEELEAHYNKVRKFKSNIHK